MFMFLLFYFLAQPPSLVVHRATGPLTRSHIIAPPMPIGAMCRLINDTLLTGE